jgi:hypothetical protein
MQRLFATVLAAFLTATACACAASPGDDVATRSESIDERDKCEEGCVDESQYTSCSDGSMVLRSTILGSGNHKTVHPIHCKPDEAMGIVKRPNNKLFGTAKAEVDVLNYLRAIGIPSIRATETVCAEIPSVHYWERYKLNSKDADFPGPYATDATLAQFYEIVDTLVVKCVAIMDLQFGIHESGRLMVVDPLSVHRNENPLSKRSSMALQMTANKLERARNKPHRPLGDPSVACTSPISVPPPPSTRR